VSRRRRAVEPVGLSFLDIICCGFGAIVLLLVITKVHQPVAVEENAKELRSRISAAREELDRIGEESRADEDRLEVSRTELEAAGAELSELRHRLRALEASREDVEQDEAIAAAIESELEEARQELTEEMRRLELRSDKGVVGGIPVDSEYIIFIIDTSGSMQKFNWNRVVAKLRETLEAYPRVKGIQIMNDMGGYLFSGYAGRWIPDSARRRQVILSRLGRWQALSNSSPVEGITEAIRTFYADDKNISLYVFGDEFSGGSVNTVVQTVDRLNQRDARGRRRVRIHSIAFPLPLNVPQVTSHMFATLMRELCQRNGGTFVAVVD
jgi:hypothetical protein